MTRNELSDHARQLVAYRLNGTLAPPKTAGYDLTTPAYGRVKVHARSHATSKHMNWYHVRNVHRELFDYLTLVEFDRHGQLSGAWGMTRERLVDFAHSVVPGAGGARITKLGVRGDWKQRADDLVHAR